ncbi:MAG TPA: hypothetical protein VFT49_01070 [Candidatus Saccharimonadales bacterium]|nr:hypothetical protein [Candidatus Saccharimonadales bacterium]
MDSIVHFFNSNFFIAIVTLAVGSAAYFVYKKQQKDHKKDAANIILLEIQNAEREIKKVKSSIANEQLKQDLQVMPLESWSKYKYLFVRDFDRDEWDAISDFYSRCLLIDEAVKYNNSAFWDDVAQIRVNKQRALAYYAKTAVDELDTSPEDDVKAEYIRKSDAFNLFYADLERQGKFGYAPVKPINDTKLYLDDLQINLSQTTVGTKLKQLAKVNI